MLNSYGNEQLQGFGDSLAKKDTMPRFSVVFENLTGSPTLSSEVKQHKIALNSLTIWYRVFLGCILAQYNGELLMHDNYFSISVFNDNLQLSG